MHMYLVFCSIHIQSSSAVFTTPKKLFFNFLIRTSFSFPLFVITSNNLFGILFDKFSRKFGSIVDHNYDICWSIFGLLDGPESRSQAWLAHCPA
jgi:hypothetical protein